MIVAIVFYQVFGRYVLNNSPTWAENLALVLVLYVTLIAAAVGVRDAGHIGMESLLVLLPDRLRDKIELVIHVCILLFGAAMAYNGWMLGKSVMHYKIPNLELVRGRALRAARRSRASSSCCSRSSTSSPCCAARRSSRHGTDHPGASLSSAS